MPKLEIKRMSELSRKEVSDRLIALGRALAGDPEVELGSDGDSITILVADQVQWELEIEVEGDKTEIEIEISWRDGPSDEAEPVVPVKPVRRARPRKSTAK